MGVAALVLGIISIVMSCVPLCNYFFIIPALVGAILGICDIVSKRKKGHRNCRFNIINTFNCYNNSSDTFNLFWSSSFK